MRYLFWKRLLVEPEWVQSNQVFCGTRYWGWLVVSSIYRCVLFKTQVYKHTYPCHWANPRPSWRDFSLVSCWRCSQWIGENMLFSLGRFATGNTVDTVVPVHYTSFLIMACWGGLQQTSITQMWLSAWVISHVIDGCFLIAHTSPQPSSIAPEKGGVCVSEGGGGFNHHLLSSPPNPSQAHSSLSLLTQAAGKWDTVNNLKSAELSWRGKIMNSHPRQASVWPDGRTTIGTGVKMRWSSMISDMKTAFYSTVELKNIENTRVWWNLTLKMKKNPTISLIITHFSAINIDFIRA